MIPLLALDESKRRAAEVGIRQDLASVNAFRSLLNNPKAAGAIGKLLTTLLFEGSLDQRVRELVILRTGWLSGSEYEFCQHVAMARRLKISDEDILGVRDPESCKSYNENDRAVLRLTDELMRGTEISPRDLERARQGVRHAAANRVACGHRELEIFRALSEGGGSST